MKDAIEVLQTIWGKHQISYLIGELSGPIWNVPENGYIWQKRERIKWTGNNHMNAVIIDKSYIWEICEVGCHGSDR